jgi:AbiV family abortive infection protein
MDRSLAVDKYPPVTLQEAVKGARLALGNGRALIEDAALLHEAGSYPRAIALAILGIEELGKIPRMLQVRRFAQDGRMNVWWKYFREHDAKSGLNALVTATAEEQAGMPTGWQIEFGRTMEAVKNRALYVDFLDGTFVSPEDMTDDPKQLSWSLLNHAKASWNRHYAVLVNIPTEGYEEYRDELRELVDALRTDPALADQYLRELDESPELRSSPELQKLRVLLSQRPTPKS